MTEGDPTVFKKNLETFQTFWERKEPGFISYFKDYYANRVGEHKRSLYSIISIFTRFLSYTQRSEHLPTGILNTETLILTCWWKGNIINGPLAFH